MNELLEVIGEHGFSEKEAEIILSEMQDEVLEGFDPEILLDEYGLDEDYIFDLLDSCY